MCMCGDGIKPRCAGHFGVRAQENAGVGTSVPCMVCRVASAAAGEGVKRNEAVSLMI